MKILSSIILILSSSLIIGEELELTTLMRQCGKKFGSMINRTVIWNDTDVTYRDVAGGLDFATVTLFQKQSYIGPGIIDLHTQDKVIQLCQDSGITDIRLHLLLSELPEWMVDLPRYMKWYYIKEYFQYVMNYYQGIVTYYDVVNHPWLLGEEFEESLGSGYIDSAFTWASEIDPNCKLILNETYKHGIKEKYREWFNKTCSTVVDLQSKNIPIHGIGMQMHTYTIKRFNQHIFKVYIDSLNSLGMEVLLSEVDVIIDTPFTEIKYELQADRYCYVLDLCLSSPNVTVFNLWDFSDRYTWSTTVSDGEYGAACIYDKEYNLKLCYYEMIKWISRRDN